MFKQMIKLMAWPALTWWHMLTKRGVTVDNVLTTYLVVNAAVLGVLVTGNMPTDASTLIAIVYTYACVTMFGLAARVYMLMMADEMDLLRKMRCKAPEDVDEKVIEKVNAIVHKYEEEHNQWVRANPKATEDEVSKHMVEVLERMRTEIQANTDLQVTMQHDLPKRGDTKH
jgi:hypothetical protein